MIDKLQQLFDYFVPAVMHVGMRYFMVAGSAFFPFVCAF